MMWYCHKQSCRETKMEAGKWNRCAFKKKKKTQAQTLPSSKSCRLLKRRVFGRYHGSIDHCSKLIIPHCVFSKFLLIPLIIVKSSVLEIKYKWRPASCLAVDSEGSTQILPVCILSAKDSQVPEAEIVSCV